MIREIQKYPTSLILSQIAEPIVDLNLAQPIIDDMIETMYESKGIGLAANQVGELYRIIVFDVEPQLKKPTVIINPEITYKSDGKIIYSEGCLSVPGFRSDVIRHGYIVVKGLDRDGKEIKIGGDKDLTSIVLQHEIDHLDGKLFIDRIAKSERKQFDKRFTKSKRKN